MRKKIGVIGKGVKLAHEFVSEDIGGADVVVVGESADLEDLAVNAPAAAVLVLGGPEACRRAYAKTLFPRGCIIGVEESQLADVAEAVLFERDSEHEVIALADGDFAPRTARIGRRGITAIV